MMNSSRFSISVVLLCAPMRGALFCDVGSSACCLPLLLLFSSLLSETMSFGGILKINKCWKYSYAPLHTVDGWIKLRFLHWKLWSFTMLKDRPDVLSFCVSWEKYNRSYHCENSCFSFGMDFLHWLLPFYIWNFYFKHIRMASLSPNWASFALVYLVCFIFYYVFSTLLPKCLLNLKSMSLILNFWRPFFVSSFL